MVQRLRHELAELVDDEVVWHALAAPISGIVLASVRDPDTGALLEEGTRVALDVDQARVYVMPREVETADEALAPGVGGHDGPGAGPVLTGQHR